MKNPFDKYSREIAGVLVLIVTFVLQLFGIDILEEQLGEIILKFVQFGSAIFIYISRINKGDVTLAGIRKQPK